MRTVAVLLLALVCFNAVTAVSLRKSAEASKSSFALERLRFIGKKNKIAHNIIAAIELHLTTGGKVDEVVQLVQAALDDVQNRRSSLSSEYQQKKSELQALIANTQQNLDNENARLEVVNDNIDSLNTELSALADQIANLQQELSDLDSREELINQARANDVNTYAARKQRDENSLDVLDQIITKLQNLAARGNSFLQVSKKDIARALKRIPKSNPIQALVQLSTQFDAEKLGNVIQKLQDIQAAIQASYVDDRNGEEESLNHYQALIAEIDALRAQKQSDLAAAQAQQRSDEVDLATYENESENLNNQIQINTQLLSDSNNELQSVISSYDARIKDTDAAISSIQTALDIIQQNIDQLQGVEEDADNVNAQASS